MYHAEFNLSFLVLGDMEFAMDRLKTIPTWKICAATGAAAFTLLGGVMVRQHHYFNYTIRQSTLGMPNKPKFDILVNSFLTIPRTKGELSKAELDKAKEDIEAAVAAAGGNVETILRAVSILRPSKNVPVDPDCDLVLLSSWPSIESFTKFKAGGLQGFSQHLAQVIQYTAAVQIVLPQVFLFTRLKCLLLRKYHDLSIKFTPGRQISEAAMPTLTSSNL